MKITEKFGSKRIVCERGEYFPLKEFLAEYGVLLRECMCDGATGESECQLQNTFKDAARFYDYARIEATAKSVAWKY